MTELSPLAAAAMATLIAGFGATAGGALPVFVVRRMSPRLNAILLSFAAGVMLAACFFSLLAPGLSLAREAASSPLAAFSGVALALALGGAVLWAAERLTPHEHFVKGRDGPRTRLSGAWLFVLAVAIHNLPEGLAVGIGAASGDSALGLGVALGIGLQNIPEGLAVAVALVATGLARHRAFAVAAATGLVETLGGVAGALAIALSANLLPWALAFAAGAMLYVISAEIIPETHGERAEPGVTPALFAGFLLMTGLDTLFGN